MSAVDFQRQRVYNWERKHIAPRCTRTVPKVDVQYVIDTIWMARGLLYPPLVEDMPKQNRRARADGSRLTIRFTEDQIPMWVVVHELAHAMTGTVHETDEAHGPNFMGVYLLLLSDVCEIPLPYSLFTLQDTKIVYNLGAKPTADRMLRRA